MGWPGLRAMLDVEPHWSSYCFVRELKAPTLVSLGGQGFVGGCGSAWRNKQRNRGGFICFVFCFDEVNIDEAHSDPTFLRHLWEVHSAGFLKVTVT